jgi:hypothetical protein
LKFSCDLNSKFSVMSRRARLEEEKLRQLNEELEEEENRIKAQKERIYAPVVWKRLGSGIRIQDLKPVYYDQVLQIIEECYFQEEVLCRNSNLAEDPESIKSFLNVVMFNLKDRTSIIALDERELSVGVLRDNVCRVKRFLCAITRRPN